MNFVCIFLTCKDTAEAQKIAHVVLEKKLVACAKIISDVESSFWWEGRINEATEVMLVMDSHESRCPSIEETVKQIHSYKVFNMMAMPTIYVAIETRKWLQESLELL